MGMFVPDRYFDTVYEVSAEMLAQNGIKGIILDIDNTLVPYEIPTPTDENKAWLKSMWNAGIKTSFVSNNHKERVELYNESLGCPAFFDSGKPFKKACKKALDAMELEPKQTVLIGDQVFTDVLAGRNSGLGMCILVKPIKDKTNLFFKFKRLLERPVIAAYKRRNAKKERQKSK